MSESCSDADNSGADSKEKSDLPLIIDASEQELTFVGNVYATDLDIRGEIVPQLEDELVAVIDEMRDGQRVSLAEVLHMRIRALSLPVFGEGPDIALRPAIDEEIAKSIMEGLRYSDRLAENGVLVSGVGFEPFDEIPTEIMPEKLDRFKRIAYSARRRRKFGDLKRILSIGCREDYESPVSKKNEIFAMPLGMTERQREEINIVLQNKKKIRRALWRELKFFLSGRDDGF